MGACELGGARICLAAFLLHQDKQTLSLSNDSALDQGRALQVSLATVNLLKYLARIGITDRSFRPPPAPLPRRSRLDDHGELVIRSLTPSSRRSGTRWYRVSAPLSTALRINRYWSSLPSITNTFTALLALPEQLSLSLAYLTLNPALDRIIGTRTKEWC